MTTPKEMLAVRRVKMRKQEILSKLEVAKWSGRVTGQNTETGHLWYGEVKLCYTQQYLFKKIYIFYKRYVFRI